MKRLFLVFMLLIAAMPFVYAANESGHSDFAYFDTFTACTNNDPTNSCNWKNDTATFINRTAFFVTIDGVKWMNLSKITTKMQQPNIPGLRESTSVFSFAYDVMQRRGDAASPLLHFRVSSATGSTSGILYEYIGFKNQTPATWYRPHNGTTEATAASKNDPRAIGRKYSVCFQMTNASHPNVPTPYKDTIRVNSSRLDQRSTMQQAAYTTIDTIEMWLDAKAEKGVYISNIRMWAGNCTNEPTSGITAPTITLAYPINKSHQNTVSWNKSIVLTTNKISTCQLNNSAWTLTRTKSNNQEFLFDRGTAPADRQYIIAAFCNSSASANRNVTLNITVDNTNPTLTIGHFRDKWFGTNGNNSYWNSSFTFSWATTDTYLYAVQTRINKWPANTSVFSRYVLLNGTSTSYNLSKTVADNATYVDGNYSVLLESTDSHTAIEFAESKTVQIITEQKDIDTSLMTMRLKYGDVKLSYPKDTTLTPIRADDAVNFEVTTEKTGQKYITLEADSVNIIKNSQYPCHFVLNFQNMQGYWWDCAGLKNPSITEIVKGKKYQIFYDLDTTKAKLESLGGLNYVKKQFFFYVDKTPPDFVVPGRNTSSTTTATIAFNTSEKTNYTYYMGFSCGISSPRNGSSATQSLIHSITRNNLRPNTLYRVNITVFDIAGNNRSRCYNVTTEAGSIFKNSLAISLLNNAGVYSLLSYANFTSPVFPNIHYNWKWYLNKTVYRQSLYTRPINWTHSITNGSCYPYVKANPNLHLVCPKSDGTTVGRTPYNETLAYDNDTSTFAFLNNSKGDCGGANYGYDTYLYFNVSYINNTYGETPKSVNLTFIGEASRPLNACAQFSYGWIIMIDQKTSGGTCGSYAIYTNPLTTPTHAVTIIPENTTVKVTYQLDRSNCLPTGKNNLMGMVRWHRGTFKLYEITTASYGYEKNYTQNKNYNLQNITPLSSSMVGEWVFSAMAYQNTTTTNETSGWYNTSVLFYPPLSNLTLKFYDEQTNALIKNGINISAIVTVLGRNNTNKTTTNASMNFYNIFPGSLEIRYQATGYFPRIYFATLPAGTTETLKLYLLNSSDTGNSYIIHTIYDQDLDYAPNVTIKLLRQYGNSFITVGMGRTNFQGEAVLSVELYDTWYKMIYENLDGTVLRVTDPSPFTRTDPVDQVNLKQDAFYSWKNYDNVVANLTLVNNSGKYYWRYTFSDTNNIMRYACLNVKRVSATESVLYCNNCTSSSTGILTCKINETLTGSYVATAFIDTNSTGSWYPLLVEWWNKPSPIRAGQAGVFIAVMIIGTMGLMGITSATGVTIFLIFGIVASFMMNLFTGFTIGYIWVLIVLGGIVLFIIRKSSGGVQQ